MDKSHLQVLQGSWRAGRENMLDSVDSGIHNLVLRKWRKGYLHIRIFLVFILHSNTHTHNTTCAMYTFPSNKERILKQWHRDSQPIYFL